MKKIMMLSCGICLSLAVCLNAEVASDITSTDAASPAINKAISQGYLTLINGSKFDSSRPVTRKEIAIIIDRLLADNETQGGQLTKVEVQELTNLSKMFKGYLAEDELFKKATTDKLAALDRVQETTNYDLTRINDELKTEIANMKKDQETQRLWTWVGIVSAGVLGMIIH